MDPNDPTTWDLSGTDPNSIPAYDPTYIPTDFGTTDMTGSEFIDWTADPGFLEWLNSGAYMSPTITDTGLGGFSDAPIAAPGGEGYAGTGVQVDPAMWDSIVQSLGGTNSALGGLASSLGTGIGSIGTGLGSFGSAIGSGLGSLGTALTGMFAQQQQANQTLAQQQAAAQQQSALASILGTGANLYGGYLNTQAAKEAAQTQANAQIEAAKIAADAAKFRPVGITTSFGSSNFGFDDQGRLTSAGYNLSPEMKAQQQALMGLSGNALNQYAQAQQATAPMAAGAQSMFGLGQQYLGTSPQAQAQKFYADQMALLAPTRAQDMAALQAQMQAQGRGGFAIGGDAGMMAANPQLNAMLNAQRQQDLQLAANATQGGMDYAKFGAGMMGLGGGMLKDMYGTQQAAYDPYKTAIGGLTSIEQMGQNALGLGMDLGRTATAANSASGQALASGMTGAANTVGNTAQAAGSTWGNLLQGAAPTLYNWGQ